MPKKTYQQFKEELLNILKEYSDLKERNSAGASVNLNQEEVRKLLEDQFIIRYGFSGLIRNVGANIPDEQKYEYYLNNTPESERDYMNKCIISTLKGGDEGGPIDLIPDEKLKEDINFKKYEDQRKVYVNEFRGNARKVKDLEKQKDAAAAGTDTSKIDEQIAQLKEKNEAVQKQIDEMDVLTSDYSKVGPEAIAAMDKIPDEQKRAEVKKIVYDSLAQVFQNNLSKSDDLISAYTSYLESIEKQGIDLEKCVPEESEYELPYEKDNDIQYREKTHEAEIAELEKGTDDPEYKAILKDINENILVYGSSKSVELTAAIAEPQGKASGRIIRDATFEELSKDIFYDGNIEKSGNTVINYELKPKDEKESLYLYDDVFSGDMKFDDETKMGILEITRYLDMVCTFRGDKEQAEQGVKVYGFEGLLTKKQALSNAIESKDEGKIQEAYRDYKRTEKIYDKMLEIANKLDNGSSMIPDNVSCARTASVPGRIRNEIVGTSRINGIWELWALSKKTGIAVENFLDSPAESYKNANEMLATTKNAMDKYFKTASIADILENAKSPATMSKLSLPDVAGQGFLNRSMEALEAISGANRVNNAVFHAKFDAVIHGPMQEQVCTLPNTVFAGDKSAAIERLFICEREDINMYNLSELSSGFNDVKTGKPYEAIDCNKYLKEGKVTSERVTFKLCEAIKEMQAKHPNLMDDKNVKKAITKTIKAVLGEPSIRKEKETTRLLTEIKNKVEADKPVNLNKMSAYRNFNIVNGVENIKNNMAISNNSKESFMESLKAMKDYKDQYDNSFIFMKWFSSKTKALLTMSEEIEQQLMDKGISVSIIESAKEYLANNDTQKLDSLCKGLENTYSDRQNAYRGDTKVTIEEFSEEIEKEEDLNASFELEKGETLEPETTEPETEEPTIEN